MYGTGLAKGLMLTLRHFVESYVDDIRYGFRKYHHSTDNFGIRQGTQTKGVITVQYPDEKGGGARALSFCALSHR